MLADPVSESSLTGNAGRLVVGDDGRAVLVLANAPSAPAGKTYQMWVIDNGRRVSAGTLLRRGTDPLAIPVDGRVAVGIRRRGDDRGRRGRRRAVGQRR